MIEIARDSYTIVVFSIPEALDPDNCNVDVEVQFVSGERYVATLFTIENIETLMSRCKTSGECNAGSYFWAADMVIIEKMTLEAIQELIEYLIDDNELSLVFSQVKDD
jgi:hypothetical protein